MDKPVFTLLNLLLVSSLNTCSTLAQSAKEQAQELLSTLLSTGLVINQEAISENLPIYEGTDILKTSYGAASFENEIRNLRIHDNKDA